ncbi:hypothetical protein FJ987_28850 [Mesorhizobium sp. CU2]|uniref:hypothetical protein n=1 Tax=unclassified Mesorhizobium TaxID=325217 RepID=UPI0011292DBA|nr:MULTISPECIES: hypothetical protein [unclassified Mesorhizobium]TPN76165.1 hypothetical protein FJ988_28470 [Mesorhizobium sp. CU3]TPO02473.1 hypothetical protein FJ987_28850 [Mesorhizobium sp. CU2]
MTIAELNAPVPTKPSLMEVSPLFRIAADNSDGSVAGKGRVGLDPDRASKAATSLRAVKDGPIHYAASDWGNVAVSQRAFIALLVLLAVLVALSATPFPGALIGFLFGITIAFFVAGPVMLIGKLLENAGVPVSGEAALWMLGGLYALLVVFAAFQIWRRLQRQEPDQARSAGLRLALLIALPSIAWLSVNAMQDAWP